MSSSEQTSDAQHSGPSWTLGKLLTWTTDFLKQHGSESAQLDAQLLLAHARKCERIELYTAYDVEASESLRTEFRELVRQRAAGVSPTRLATRSGLVRPICLGASSPNTRVR